MRQEIVIYGAGEQGRAYLEFLKSKEISNIIYGFCDKNATEIQSIGDKKVYQYQELKNMNLIYILALSSKAAIDEVTGMLEHENKEVQSIDFLAKYVSEDKVEFNREICAYIHQNSMDTYFTVAEKETALAPFWGADTDFYRLFKKLDLSNVIELAVGKGRHVSQYIQESGTVTLVDILSDNISFCKSRFKQYDNIVYYCNNGYNLEELESNSYTALFCYDSMVHFELIDIFTYLNDIYRVMKKGSYVLIHHSNNGNDYKASFANAFAGRSFMTKEVFAYLSYRAGFVVIEQKVIDWQIKNLDCISLLQKC